MTQDCLRYCLTICGIKIKFPRPLVLIRKKSSPFYKYKKNGLDITKLPKAEGQLRDIQLANFAILKEIDYVCRKNKIQYWLDYGTLLGAVRHKGYIPWDDDIDISMLRKDFEHFIKCFNSETRNNDLYLKHYFNSKTCSYLLKVCDKKCKYLFVDVFVYDYCPAGFTENQKLEYTQHLQNMREEFIKNLKFKDGFDLYQKYEQLRTEIQKSVDMNDSDLMYYIEFGHKPYIRNNYVMPKNDILPLREVEFENKMFLSVNKPEEHLIELFNNYNDYPKNINYGHSAYVKLSDEDKKEIKSLIEKS